MNELNAFTDEDIQYAIVDKTKELLQQARDKYSLQQIPVDVCFSKKGIVGGCAGKVAGRYTLNFNLELARENLPEYLDQIIGHELAHLVDLWLHNDKSSGHGYEWQCIMVQCYGLVPARCHQMDTSRTANRLPRNYIYACTGCHKEYNLTSILHDKIQRGHGRICNVCKSKIVYTGEKPAFGLGE